MIIIVVDQKAGCVKGTSATNLAAMFVGEGGEALIVDADTKQHSATNWDCLARAIFKEPKRAMQ